MEDNNIKPRVQEPVVTTASPPEVAQQSSKSHKKRNMIISLALLLVVGIGVLVALTVFGNSDTVESDRTEMTNQVVADPVVQLAAAIGLVEGTVQHSSDGQAWIDAMGGETISQSQYVRTLAESRAVLLLDDGSAVRLDANSQMQLSVSDTNTVEIMLVGGQLYSRVIESETRAFAVLTENERFEARGTAYKTSTGEFDEVEVYQSSVMVDSSGTEVEEGNKYNTQTKEKSDIDLASLSEDEFVQWNKQKDSETSEFKDKLGVLKDAKKVSEPAPEPEPATDAEISLTGQATGGGVKLSWALSGAPSADGFKIVRDTSDTTPSYGDNKSVYVSSGEQRSYTIDLKDGKTYNLRVCVYRAAAGSCDTYSNTVTVTAPLKPLEAVAPGDVVLAIEGAEINWSFAGTAPHGFKVVLGEQQTPTYPSNSIQYVGADASSTELPKKPAGTYYVRVCKYTASSEISGGCTDYSNQVEYTVAE